MQYKVYTDKQENFICEINLTGASLTNAKSRIIVSSDVANIMFEGNVDSSGKCTVPIKKLQGLLPEGTTGDIKLEVIADDTYFQPWSSNFIVEASKKITVEVKSQSQKVIEESKPKMKVIVETDKKTHVVNILREIKKQKITLKNIDQKRDDLTEIITNYQSSFTLTEQEKSYIISTVLKALEKFS
jgi:hypothetical protein|tara:strand:+ start:18 stop:575 length:558 start_codon:yes stop_codon:yes gene_type:complete